MTFILDASAVLAVLLDETGAEVVAPLVRGSELLLVNHCEVLSKIAKEGGDWRRVDAVLLRFGIDIVPFTHEHSLEAARLRPLTKAIGLSLGDRSCLAHGSLTKLPILTADKRMAQADVGLDIRMIR
jgi:ribonuclease VapC